MKTESGIERALIAKGMYSEIVIACDGPWMLSDLENITDGTSDIGLDGLCPKEPGLYLFTGQAKMVVHGGGWDSGGEPSTEWEGAVQPADSLEIINLLDAFRRIKDEVEKARQADIDATLGDYQ